MHMRKTTSPSISAYRPTCAPIHYDRHPAGPAAPTYLYHPSLSLHSSSLHGHCLLPCCPQMKRYYRPYWVSVLACAATQWAHRNPHRIHRSGRRIVWAAWERYMPPAVMAKAYSHFVADWNVIERKKGIERSIEVRPSLNRG